MSEVKDNISSLPIRRSYVIAAAIFVLLALWVASGAFNRTDADTKSTANAAAASAPTAKADEKPGEENKDKKTIPTVRVRTLTAEVRAHDIVVRGQTAALRKVQVRAETAGKVAAIRADKGVAVKEGQTICELNVDARTAMLAEARATMKQRELEYEASKKLQEKGFRSDTSVAGDLAQYQAAKAQVERMEKEFENTRLKAPFDGVVDDRMVDVGDYLSPGQPCATVIDQDPFLVVGSVSEKEVGKIKIGDPGWAQLVTGERADGAVRFVAKSADAATRTFRLELQVPNKDGALRDGVTAEIHVTTEKIEAHKISPAILALDDRGVVGVRTVDDKKRVRFVEVKIVGDADDGVWVSGLPKSVTIITVGQDYVTNGQEVNAVPEAKGTQS